MEPSTLGIMSIRITRCQQSLQLSAARPKGWLSFFICLGLALAVGIVFGQTVRYEFINYDDDLYIYENPAVTGGFDLHKIAWVFMHNNGFDGWFPLTDVSHMLDWQFYGPNAGGHHLTNVLLHTATVILLFLVLQKTTGATWRSAFVATFFAIHPLRVESVAWVAERKDVLSGLFFVLTLWMWARYAQKRPVAEIQKSSAGKFPWFPDPRQWTLDYCLALVFFALGLLSKPMLVTLPFILLLLDRWPLNRMSHLAVYPPRLRLQAWLGLILEKTPFLLFSVAMCMVTVLSQKTLVLMAKTSSLSWRLGNILQAYVDYMKHMVYPAGLHLLYSPPETHLEIVSLVLSILILGFISAGTIVGRRKYPYLMVGWLWYLGMFVPVIDIVQVGVQARADRYTYLPQIGLYIVIVWGTVELCGSWRFRRVVLGSAAGIIVAALMTTAYVQTKYWKNSVSLWEQTLAYTPQSYIAHCNLGIVLANQGQLDEAIQHFDRALQFKPDDLKVYNNLGKVLMAQGKLNEAVQAFDRAQQINPEDATAWNNLGVAFAAQGKPDEAIQHYERSLRIQPNYVDALYNLGNALMTQGRLDEAAHEYEQALQLNPNFAEVHCNFGLVLARQGKLDEAVQHYNRAIQLKSDYADARNNLAGLLAAQQKMNEAAQYYEQALQINPNNVDALNNLGVILARQGKLAEAVQDFDRALHLNPEDASTCNNIGIALASQGKLDEAIQYFQKALSLATRHNNTALAASIRTRLKTYQPALSQP
jgi:tetratricopeptide (TPR) repeat protein